MGELRKTEDGKRRLALTKDRLDRVAHDVGNSDGRQNLSQGELVDNGQASAAEVPPEIVESNVVPSFLPMSSESRIGQPRISDEARSRIGQPRVSDEARSGGHEVRSGGHEVRSGGHEVHSGGHVVDEY